MTQSELLKKNTVNQNLCLKAIIQDIQECRGPMEELNDLNKKGREKILEIKKCISNLKTMVIEELKPNVRLPLENDVKDLEDELRVTIAAFQKANVDCALNIQKNNREELLGANDDVLLRHRKKKDKEELVKMSSDVTERLLSISRNLSDTTQRNADTLQNLVTSSNVVDGTRTELDAQGNVIFQSGKLLSKYGRREQTDKFLILFASAVFFLCVIYILQKRLF